MKKNTSLSDRIALHGILAGLFLLVAFGAFGCEDECEQGEEECQGDKLMMCDFKDKRLQWKVFEDCGDQGQTCEEETFGDGEILATCVD